MNSSSKIEEIAYALYKADSKYRGLIAALERPVDVYPIWYIKNIDNWPWYVHMAEEVLDLFE